MLKTQNPKDAIVRESLRTRKCPWKKFLSGEHPVRTARTIHIWTKFVLTLFVLTILSSCVTQQRCLDKFPPQTVTLIKDSIVCVPDSILIPGKTVTMESTSPCPPSVVFHSEIKKNGLTSIVDIKNGVITQTCHDDSLMREIQRRDHYIQTHKQIVLPAKEVYITHWYDMLARWASIILFLIWVVIILDRTVLKGKI